MLCVLLAGCSVLFDPTDPTDPGTADQDGGSLDGGGVRGDILFEDDFEEGLIKWDLWTSPGATITGSTQESHGGSRSAHCVSTEDSGTQAALHVALEGDPSTRSDIYVGAHIFLDTGFPQTDAVSLVALWSGNGIMAQVWIEPGAVVFKNEQGDDYIPINYEVPAGEWIPFQLRLNTNDGSGHVNLRMGRTELIDSTTPFTNDTPVDALNIGVEWQSQNDKHHELFVDDVLVMDQLE
jgi:hypothetical protein